MRNYSANLVNGFSGPGRAPRLPARFCGRSVLRRSRFHTGKGQFAIRSAGDTADAAWSLLTAILRACFGRHVRARLGPSARVCLLDGPTYAGVIEPARRARRATVCLLDGPTCAGVIERARRARVYLLDGSRRSKCPRAAMDKVAPDGDLFPTDTLLADVLGFLARRFVGWRVKLPAQRRAE